MAWLRVSDDWDDDPAILNICRTRGDQARVLGWVLRLKLYCARHLTDGYLPDLILRDIVRSKRWREELAAPANGGTALIHGPGDVCECLKDRGWPATAADWYVHAYLGDNPSREEYDVQRAKQAELRDRELQATVRHRDRGRCRYCGVKVTWADRRSSAGGVYDHVDPARAGGASNLVVACRGCNSRKGHRTPAAAGMTLLPVPDETSDPAGRPGGDQTRTNRFAADRTTHVRVRDGTGRVPIPATPSDGDQETSTGPPATVRTSAHPNPYHRDAITGADPDDHAGLPDPVAVDDALTELFREEINEDL